MSGQGVFLGLLLCCDRFSAVGEPSAMHPRKWLACALFTQSAFWCTWCAVVAVVLLDFVVLLPIDFVLCRAVVCLSWLWCCHLFYCCTLFEFSLIMNDSFDCQKGRAPQGRSWCNGQLHSQKQLTGLCQQQATSGLLIQA